MRRLARGRRASRCPSGTLLRLGLALLVAACGSQGTALTTGHELDRFPQQVAHATTSLPAPPTTSSVERTYITAVSVDAQAFWRREFTAAHLRYPTARVVVFSGETRSGCGAHEGGGSFYCPADDGVYLDLTFFEQFLRDSRLGPAAQGYIIGHEIAHHVQRFLGIAGRVDAANRADPKGKNGRTVLVELQADCLAGVWAHAAYPRSGLTAGDLDHARKLAEMIGDDYLAQAAGEVVDKTLWTHGSSQQRQYWLRTGFQSGRPNACDTFASSRS